MKLRAVLTVTVDTEGDYYADHDDMVRHVIPWIEGTLEDRDNIRNVAITEAAIRTAAGQDQPATEGAPLVLPLAQVRFLHETLGRLLPDDGRPAGQDQPHERRERYAAAMYDTLNVSPIRHPWASLGDLRRIVWHRRADAAMAVADAEQRELRAELSAAYEEANELALHNDATCETVKERDGLLAERDRLRAELAQARSAAFIEGAVAVAADTEYGFATDYAGRHEALLRRMATEAQQAGHPQPTTGEQPA